MKLMDRFIDEDVSKLKFTNQEQSVYHYITQNLDRIGEITAKEIAKECFCTTTTVNRFCKKYGIAGFSDFSAILNYEMAQLDNNDIEEEVFDNEFLNKINKDKPLFIFGSGASLFTAHVLERYLLRRGYICILLEDRFFLKEVMRDQVFLFSNSGMTAPALDLAYFAKKNGMTVFSVTALGSELASISDHPLVFNNKVARLSEKDHEAQLQMHTTLIKIMD